MSWRFFTSTSGPSEAKILTALFERIVWEDPLDEDMKEMVDPLIPLSLQELAFQNVMPPGEDVSVSGRL
jgi:hypothetical protein